MTMLDTPNQECVLKRAIKCLMSYRIMRFGNFIIFSNFIIFMRAVVYDTVYILSFVQ